MARDNARLERKTPPPQPPSWPPFLVVVVEVVVVVAVEVAWDCRCSGCSGRDGLRGGRARERCGCSGSSDAFRCSGRDDGGNGISVVIAVVVVEVVVTVVVEVVVIVVVVVAHVVGIVVVIIDKF